MRTVTLTMQWEEHFDVEVEDDAPEVTDIDGFMEHYGDVKPFDPMTLGVSIDDPGPSATAVEEEAC